MPCATTLAIDSRTRRLEAALATIRRKGYHATTAEAAAPASKAPATQAPPRR